MAGKKRRNPKGSIAFRVSRTGLISLRWTYQGRERNLATGLPDNPEGRNLAHGIAGRIRDDIAFQRFDETLDKYRPQGAALRPLENIAGMVEPFIDWKRSQGLAERTLIDNYIPALRLVQHCEGMPSSLDVARLVKVASTGRSAYTFNRYLGYWKDLGRWAVKFGHWPSNPFTDVSRQKIKRDRSNKRPFTNAEAPRILETAKGHEPWAFYHDMIRFMLLLGSRPGEVSELRWKDVDLEARKVTISRQAAKVPGQHGMDIKPTKGENTRTLKLVPSVAAMLKARKPKRGKLSALIFPAPKGGHLDTSNFAQRVWKPILEAAEVDHRSPNVCRHTFISNLIEMGATFPQAAKKAGHNDSRMVAQNYAHAMSEPEMPDMY